MNNFCLLTLLRYISLLKHSFQKHKIRIDASIQHDTLPRAEQVRQSINVLLELDGKLPQLKSRSLEVLRVPEKIVHVKSAAALGDLIVDGAKIKTALVNVYHVLVGFGKVEHV